MVTVRYTDLDPAISGTADFIVRRRTPTILQMGVVFFSALLIAVSLVVVIGSKQILSGVVFVLLGTLGWYVILQTQRNRDLLLATEFQNALFASALGLNNKFCIIIRRDGNIVYLDRSFQQMFPEFLKQAHRTIDVLLEQGGISRMESQKVYSAIDQGIYDKVIFDMRGGDGKFYKIVMSIEPILRPSGFILLRGREYVERRGPAPASGESVGTKDMALNKSNITLFSHVMDTMNMGVYMTGPGGNVIYANVVLENWLGYDEGELTSKATALPDIVQPMPGSTTRIAAGDYEGEVMLVRKVGTPMRAFINQKIIRDEAGKMVGCTALVHNFTAQDGELKKKLW